MRRIAVLAFVNAAVLAVALGGFGVAGAGCPSTPPAGGGEGEGEGAGGEGEGAGGEGEGAGGEGEGAGGEGEGAGGEGEGAGGEGEGEGEGAAGGLGDACDAPPSGGCGAGLACGFDGSSGALETVCVNPPAGLATGAACNVADPTQCAFHLCLGATNGAGLCSAPCAHDSDCAATQVCGASSITVDGAGGVAHVCVANGNIPPTPCTHDGDCSSIGEVCDDIVQSGANLALQCGLPGTGGALGASCASPQLSDPSTCATGLCDGTSAGICTVACATNNDCSGGLSCVGSGFTNVPERFCGKACVNDTPCGAGRSCQLRDDRVADLQDQVCSQNDGTSTPGTNIAGSSAVCTSGLAVNLQIGTPPVQKTVCSAICNVSGDCSTFNVDDGAHTSITTCAAVNGFTTPSGAPQPVNLCVH